MGVRQRRSKFLEALVEELIAFGEHGWRLDRKRDDGASERDHLESAARQIANLPGWKGKKKAEEIVPEAPPFPDVVAYLWNWFSEISLGLSSSGMGPPLVTWEAVAAWCGLTGTSLDSWESRALVRLGYARAVIESERISKEAKAGKDGRSHKD